MHNQTLPMVNPYNGRVFGSLPDSTSSPISPIISSQFRVPTTTFHRTDPSRRRSKDAASDSVTFSSSPISGCVLVIPVHSKDQRDCDPHPQPFLDSHRQEPSHSPLLASATFQLRRSPLASRSSSHVVFTLSSTFPLPLDPSPDRYPALGRSIPGWRPGATQLRSSLNRLVELKNPN